MASGVVNVSEYELLAKQKLPAMAYGFYSSGAEDEWSLKENRAAFSRLRIRPRLLIDVSHIDLSAIVLGHKIRMPIMVAPTALHRMGHPEGEVAVARAVAAAGTVMALSSNATSSIEEVAATGPATRFFQLYVFKDRAMAVNLVRRAEREGYKAIVLTVDVPRMGRREPDIRNKFALSPHLSLKNLEGMSVSKIQDALALELPKYSVGEIDMSLSWKDIKWLHSITSLPVVVKGILTAEDARLAVAAGAAAVVVSNHGARQLDHVPASISALEEVVEAIGTQIPVFLDGGIRRGTDVFKALALGATAVFVGRPIIFGLAVDGEAGVRKVLEMLREEFETVMALAGCCSLRDIRRSHVRWDIEEVLRLAKL